MGGLVALDEAHGALGRTGVLKLFLVFGGEPNLDAFLGPS